VVEETQHHNLQVEEEVELLLQEVLQQLRLQEQGVQVQQIVSQIHQFLMLEEEVGEHLDVVLVVLGEQVEVEQVEELLLHLQDSVHQEQLTLEEVEVEPHNLVMVVDQEVQV
jgi:uncharacterized protein YpuA (DUF1002 family)